MSISKQLVLALLTCGLGVLALGPALAAPPEANHAATALPRDPLAVGAVIDREIDACLTKNKVFPSPPADDAEFLRRLSLDVRGRIPTPEVTAAFLADRDPNKRSKLIDRFLSEHEYGQHFGVIWYHAMIKPSTENQFAISPKLQDWLADRFNQNQRWDHIVRDILTASGDRDANPATVFWLAHVQNKKQLAPERVAASASHLFLGVRLECCECHNHPFDTLQRTDFWGVTAFFTGTRLEHADKKEVRAGAVPGVVDDLGSGRRRKAKSASPAPPGSVVVPDTQGQVVKAHFLLGETPAVKGKPLRTVFADWVTARDNPYFARAFVNRMWAHFFGRGLVNPIDNLRPNSRTHHPELLTILADEFTASGFDVKHLIRCICSSKAYQRASTPLPDNKGDEELFSHMKLKPMTADMLFDSLTVALGHEPAGGKAKGRKGKLYKGASSSRDQFCRFFNAEADDDAGVMEEYTHGIPQVLRLMNSGQVNDTATVVGRLLESSAGPESVIRLLYLRVLSRPPTEAETRRMRQYVESTLDPARGHADVMWALLNSSEFLFNH
jgi:hypothetical protein